MRLVLLLIPLVLFACNKEQAAPPTVKAESGPDFASAFKHSERWDPAKKALVVEVSIEPGFHAYTTGEETGKPLLVQIAEDGDFRAAAEIEYPKGVTKDLPIGRSVIVEGSAQIVAPLEPKDAAAAGPKKAKGTLRYQVCTDKACDRPRTVPISVDVSG